MNKFSYMHNLNKYSMVLLNIPNDGKHLDWYRVRVRNTKPKGFAFHLGYFNAIQQTTGDFDEYFDFVFKKWTNGSRDLYKLQKVLLSSTSLSIPIQLASQALLAHCIQFNWQNIDNDSIESRSDIKKLYTEKNLEFLMRKPTFIYHQKTSIEMSLPLSIAFSVTAQYLHVYGSIPEFPLHNRHEMYFNLVKLFKCTEDIKSLTVLYKLAVETGNNSHFVFLVMKVLQMIENGHAFHMNSIKGAIFAEYYNVVKDFYTGTSFNRLVLYCIAEQLKCGIDCLHLLDEVLQSRIPGDFRYLKFGFEQILKNLEHDKRDQFLSRFSHEERQILSCQ